LKQLHFGAPVPLTSLPASCVNNAATVGISSTPVIDPASRVMYFIAYNATLTGPTYYLHKINLLDLSDNVPMVQVAATSKLSDGSTVTFQAAYQRQRPALLL
jgi:hypothetical protein